MANNHLTSTTKNRLSNRAKMNIYRKLFTTTQLKRHFLLVKKYSVLALMDKANGTDQSSAETIH